MSLYEEAAREAATEKIEETAENIGYDPTEDSAPGYRFQAPDFSFLKAPTGEGSVEEYLEHPLNFDKKKSTARIIRGLTGLFGMLNYALIDITLGIIEKWKEKDKVQENVYRP